jgi:hypothetical protein
MDTSGAKKWNTLAGSLVAIDQLRPHCDETQISMLNEYQIYLRARIAAGG